MQMRPEVQIAAMIKALTDVIIPAVPRENRLATEQAGLVVGMLNLMRFQLPLQFRFDRDELRRLVDAADDVDAEGSTDAGTAAAIERLGEPRRRAADVLECCQGEPAELYAAILEMRSALCALVDASAGSADIGGRERIEAILLSMSKAQLLRDRALVKLQRWEPDPDAVPEIGTLIGN